MRLVVVAAFLCLVGLPATRGSGHTLTVAGTKFLLDGQPFPYTGVSFFNAIYNPSFNRDSTERKRWLGVFQRYGINVLRVWAQWDNRRGFVDAAPDSTLYQAGGHLRPEHLRTLKDIIRDADDLGMAIEFVLFSQESWHDGIKLAPDVADRAVGEIARELQPYRNVTFQVWNEFAERVPEHVKTIKAIDPKRLVTNSPGFAGYLGDPAHNAILDYLTPHTTRQGSGRTWEIAPREIEYLLTRFRKPVVDDEPARNGTSNFGGPKQPTNPYDHILQMAAVWAVGGYITYHHDMFQTGYGTPACPPSGIPDPEFSPYHRQCFEFISLRSRYMLSELK